MGNNNIIIITARPHQFLTQFGTGNYYYINGGLSSQQVWPICVAVHMAGTMLETPLICGILALSLCATIRMSLLQGNK